jgi:chromatin remodeling complex protein RSC6
VRCNWQPAGSVSPAALYSSGCQPEWDDLPASIAWVMPAKEAKSIKAGGCMPTKSTEKPRKAAVHKPAAGGKANALQKPLQPSAELATVVGSEPVARGEVVRKVWDYIKSNNLQNPENRREIIADDKLRKVFGKDKVSMFEMNKHLAQHLK